MAQRRWTAMSRAIAARSARPAKVRISTPLTVVDRAFRLSGLVPRTHTRKKPDRLSPVTVSRNSRPFQR